MVSSAAGISFAVLLVMHLALVIWASRKIFKSEISAFEKSSWFLLCLILPLLGVGVYATYEKKYLLKIELAHIVLAIIILGFAFSFRQWGVEIFSVGTGFSNWLKMSCLALVALGIHIWAQKGVARHFDVISRFRIWKLGVALSIILAFLTNGWFIWAAVGCATISTQLFYRPGRLIEEEVIMPYEISKIIVAGAFANIGLAVLGKFLVPYLGTLAHRFMVMNLWIAVFSVIPLFMARISLSFGTSRVLGSLKAKKTASWIPGKFGTEKPYLVGKMPIVLPKTIRRIGETWLSEGEIIFFGSRMIWVFAFVFVVVTTALILFLNPFLAVLIAAILATVMIMWWHSSAKREPQVWKR